MYSSVCAAGTGVTSRAEQVANTKCHSLCIAGDKCREFSPNDCDCCIQLLNWLLCVVLRNYRKCVCVCGGGGGCLLSIQLRRLADCCCTRSPVCKFYS
jgi:hypothetical protein